MSLTHLGHACVLYETPSSRLLVDPGTMSSFSDLRDLTAVLVTHEHADHVDVPAVLEPSSRPTGRPAWPATSGPLLGSPRPASPAPATS